MKKGGWFNGPEWLIDPEKWPKQPKLERTKGIAEEQKPMAEVAFRVEEKTRKHGMSGMRCSLEALTGELFMSLRGHYDSSTMREPRDGEREL